MMDKAQSQPASKQVSNLLEQRLDFDNDDGEYKASANGPSGDKPSVRKSRIQSDEYEEGMLSSGPEDGEILSEEENMFKPSTLMDVIQAGNPGKNKRKRSKDEPNETVRKSQKITTVQPTFNDEKEAGEYRSGDESDDKEQANETAKDDNESAETVTKKKKVVVKERLNKLLAWKGIIGPKNPATYYQPKSKSTNDTSSESESSNTGNKTMSEDDLIKRDSNEVGQTLPTINATSTPMNAESAVDVDTAVNSTAPTEKEGLSNADEGSQDSDGESEDENDADDNTAGRESEDQEFEGDVESWLDEGMKTYKTQAETGETTTAPLVKDKIVLKEYGADPFEFLPEDWVCLTHDSGMPIYLHKQSRVCTLARPYFLGPGSARKHDIPLCAVPCMSYRREKEKYLRQAKLKDANVDVSESNKPESACQSNITDNQQVQPMVPIKTEDTPTRSQNGASQSNPAIPLASQTSLSTTNGIEGNICPNAATDNLNDSNAAVVTQTSAVNAPDTAADTAVNEAKVPTSASTENGDGEKVIVDPAVQDLGNKIKILGVEQQEKEVLMKPEELHEYCKTVFDFKTITIKRFKTWKDRRKHENKQKQNRPTLPVNTKLITYQVPLEDNGDDKEAKKKKELIMNPHGKSPVCILHEYVQHILKSHPTYTFKEIDNTLTPFQATIVINNVEYGVGRANSKKAAKLDAAKKTLAILIPEMAKLGLDELNTKEFQDYELFDVVKIEDPRVNQMSSRAGQPSPYQILLQCLNRNYGMGDTEISVGTKTMKHRKNEFTMSVGKHTVTVECKNKRIGKQLAAQSILKLLHPYIQCWGSLLRLYGRESLHAQKERKEDTAAVTGLQNPIGDKDEEGKKVPEPKYSILNKLREEMVRIRQQQEKDKLAKEQKQKQPIIGLLGMKTVDL